MDGADTPRPTFRDLIDFLGGDDDDLADRASDVLVRLGTVARELLVRTVSVRDDKSPVHRVRLLGVIQRIGPPIGFDELGRLQTLLRFPHPAVREKVIEVLQSFGPSSLGMLPLVSLPDPSRRNPKRADDVSRNHSKASSSVVQRTPTGQVVAGDIDDLVNENARSRRSR